MNCKKVFKRVLGGLIAATMTVGMTLFPSGVMQKATGYVAEADAAGRLYKANNVTGVNGKYTLITGGTDKSLSYGKPKIVVYYRLAQDMTSIWQVYLASQSTNADILCVEMTGASQSTILSEMNDFEIDTNRIKFSYDNGTVAVLNGEGAVSASRMDCIKYANYLKGDSRNEGSSGYPFVMYIDSNNVIQSYTEGYSQGSIRIDSSVYLSNINSYCTDAYKGGTDSGNDEEEEQLSYTMDLYGCKMILDDSYTMEYSIIPSDGFIKASNPEIVFSYYYSQGSKNTKRFKLSDLKHTSVKNDKGEYVGCYTFQIKFDAKEIGMSVEYYLTETTNNSTHISNIRNDSVMTYAEAILRNESQYAAKDVKLIKAVINYGTKTQSYMNYYADSNSIASKVYRNAGVSQPAVTSVANVLQNLKNMNAAGMIANAEYDTAQYLGSSVVLDNTVSMKVYFKLENKRNTGTYRVRINSQEYYGNNILQATSSANVYFVEIADIPFNQYSNNFNVQLIDNNAGANQNKKIEVICNPMRYVYSGLSEYHGGTAYNELLCAFYDLYKAESEY